MNGGQALIRTLVGAGVEVCFSNPGTSEMHFVAALDAVPEMRGVLALFEGVATGAADGYGRMADAPAATLLHLGPGLGNGLANLHNARKARTPIVNVVGDHATYHGRFDAQLQSDIETVARNVSTFVRRSASPRDVGADALDAVRAALGPPGRVATLILPADVSWGEGAAPAAAELRPRMRAAPGDAIDAIAKALLSGEKATILIGGRACRAAPRRTVAAIAARTGATVLCETFPARLERGAGLPPLERLAYLGEWASAQLAGTTHLVLVEAKRPVTFFAYPGKPSDLVPEGCEVHVLADEVEDVAGALDALADAVGATDDAPVQQPDRPALPDGDLTAETAFQAIGALLPEGAIVSDEANTSGLFAPAATAGAPAHDWLTLTGGSIGQGLPVAVGAAVACPDRRVVALEADGSALYTLQSWWTMARERLDVTTVLFNNRSYAILNMELARVGAAAAGPKAKDMLDLSRPDLDFAALARGMGLEAWRATTAGEFAEQLGRALATPGPTLVEAVLPPAFS
ncbi:MAG TPA: acetolactate synthase large subunit [Actinomycetota bacterium]